MRKLPVVLAAALLLAAGTLSANELGATEPKKDLATQISDLLKDNSFIVQEGDITANVLFTLNHNKEIVVISVDTKDELLERFVKSRLNYQQVSLDQTAEGKLFTVPVRITE